MSSTAESDKCRLIPLESLGNYRTLDPRSKPKKLPPFEAEIPEAFAEKCRQWKLKQRKEKPRKRKHAAEEPMKDPRNDPGFDPSNPLGL